jgi:hypothetical protein
MDSAIKHGESDRQIVLRMMLTNFGSIHTTSLVSSDSLSSIDQLWVLRACDDQTFTNALLTLLAHTQYIDPLRIEIEQAIKEEGWTKAAMDKMELLESFMKESQRVDIIGAGKSKPFLSFYNASQRIVSQFSETDWQSATSPLTGCSFRKAPCWPPTSSTPISQNPLGAPTRSSLTFTAASSFRKNLESRSGSPQRLLSC